MGWRCSVTWDTLDEVGHHATEVGSDVLEDLQLFVVLGLQQHAGQVHILQKESAQSQRITLQSPVSTAQRRGG